jgi:hypothetical protein
MIKRSGPPEYLHAKNVPIRKASFYLAEGEGQIPWIKKTLLF